MKWRINHDDEHSRCKEVDLIRASEMTVTSLNIMVHIWLEGSVFV